MKAIVQGGYGSADVLQLREIHKPVVTEGGVLIRVRAASVNALDWHSVHGRENDSRGRRISPGVASATTP